MGPCTIVSVALLLALSALPIAQLTCPGNRSPPPVWWRCQPAARQTSFRYYLFLGRNTSAADTSNLVVPTMADFNTDCLRGFLTELAITGPFVAASNQCFPPKACTATERYIIMAKTQVFTPQLITSGEIDFPECPLFDVTRGIISYPNGRRFYANAKIICPEGYVLDSQKPVFCEHDGRWLHLLIDGTTLKSAMFNNKACIACSNQPVIQNGNIISCPGRETAEIQCNNGYTFSGRTTALHFHNTTWTEPEGVCGKQCPASQDINNGFLRIGDVRVNSTALVVCDTNSSRNGSSLATCESGNWSIPDGACELKSCQNPNSPTNGMVSNGSNEIYTVRTFNCKDGYELKGSNATTCLYGQRGPVWVPNTPECVLNYCQNLISPANGMALNGSNVINSVREFTCQDGFQLKGSNETTCVAGQHGPEWLPDTPECVLNYCQNLIGPANGMASNGSNVINSVREFTCQDGFQLKGNNETTCVAGEQGPEWLPDTPECVPVHCQIPDDMADHFFVISGTSVNSTLTLFCKRGTIAAGRPAVCGANGSWSDLRLTSCDLTSSSTATPATPVKSKQGDVLGFSGSIALIVIIACLVVAIVLSLVISLVLRRRREYKPSQDHTDMQPVPKKKASRTSILQDRAASSRQRLDQWEDDTYNTLDGPEAVKDTEKATAPATGDSDNADLYDHLAPEKDGAIGAPQAGRESLSEQQKDALIPGEVYSTVAETTGGSKSLYENTLPKEVSASTPTPADVAPPAAAIGDDTGGLYTTVVFTSKKKETAQGELGPGAEQGESHPFVSAADPQTIYTTVSLKARK